MSLVQTIMIGSDEAEQRLDRWFRRNFPHVTQGQIEKLCRKGDIRVDGGRVKANSRVEPGQTVRIPPLPAPGTAPKRTTTRISKDDAEMMRSVVLYRDDHLLVLNKPSGLPSQGGSGHTRHIDGLSEALCFDHHTKPRLVHRLDKDTSGVLLMARTQRVASDLTAAFRARDTRKIYWAVVAGVPHPAMGTIRFGLVKAAGHGAKGEAEKMLCIHPDKLAEVVGAKRATTDYAVLSRLASRAAWMALVPVTGRTHQLRAHMAELGHPIIGDGKYGGSGQENLGDGWGAQLGGEVSNKLHLHARSLRITHPVTGAAMTFTAPLPPHMVQTWDIFGWSANDVPADPFEDVE